MSVTLTSNYQEVLKPDTLAKIQELCDEGDFDLGAALEFIDEKSEEDFVEFYEEYVALGEEYNYEAVDAFLTENDLDDLSCFEVRYIGCYSTPAEMARDYFNEEWERIDYRISIDWEDTGDYLVMHNVDQYGDYYFRCDD